MADSYCSFAEFYEGLMEDAEYPQRAEYFLLLCERFNHRAGKALDLACGTGAFTRELKKRGVDVIGCDLSFEMLSEAAMKSFDEELPIFYINQDMRALDLGEKLDTCFCTLDSINHLTDEEDVLKTFEGVSGHLKTDGLFIFDVNTVYKHREVLGDNDFIIENEEVFCAWQNSLEDDDTVRIDLDFFKKSGRLYERFSESFCERAYSEEKLKEMLVGSGLEVLGVFGDLSFEPPAENEQRAVFVARKMRN